MIKPKIVNITSQSQWKTLEMNLFISWFDYFFDIKDNDNFNDKIYMKHCQMSFLTRLSPTTKMIIYYDSGLFISLYIWFVKN